MEAIPTTEYQSVFLNSQKIDGRHPQIVLASRKAILQRFLYCVPLLIHADFDSHTRHAILDEIARTCPVSVKNDNENCGTTPEKSEVRVALPLNSPKD
jgi:hypothetical protein